VDRNISEKTIKQLFGRASSCGYPECPELLIVGHRGGFTTNVQICHVRSQKTTGPRHDAQYPKELIDEEENLLLLCLKHHSLVDDLHSEYSVEELLEWKQAQEAHGTGGALVGRALTSSELAQVVEALRLTAGLVDRLQSTSMIATATSMHPVGSSDSDERCSAVANGSLAAPVVEFLRAQRRAAKSFPYPIHGDHDVKLSDVFVAQPVRAVTAQRPLDRPAEQRVSTGTRDLLGPEQTIEAALAAHTHVVVTGDLAEFGAGRRAEAETYLRSALAAETSSNYLRTEVAACLEYLTADSGEPEIG
jgi:hypothetical protein